MRPLPFFMSAVDTVGDMPQILPLDLSVSRTSLNLQPEVIKDRISYTCQECYHEFFSRNGLAYHRRQHRDLTKVYCADCRKFFKVKQPAKCLTMCPYGHSINSNLQCNQCPARLDSFTILQLHLKAHTNFKHNCKYCNQAICFLIYPTC